ncbi:oxidoreductase [Halopelagius longus]|uniref:2,4-dienoyl-CoA reductase n=1 Tax=Halopelagius longus TaxID=1236180 RepID=A0A1H0XU37_9EURY|nr:tRNA-dihydrouridine synthase [Halopelagius longus]RDI72094.1 NADH:flavin oxidoreductase [Halopelagius longus]SDQ06403.1 2,4-dienoyl-CoA reductase [Halopelagius longus]
MAPALEDPVSIAGLDVPNRLYRAPLLECAGEESDAVDILREELEPAAASGVGLICQGASPVREETGHVAPNMTSFADRAFARGLRPLTEAVHDHGAKILAQLDHGGIRSLETWHAAYREERSAPEQLAVSPLPTPLKLLDAAGILSYDARVLSTEAVYELAADFGRCAEHAVEAGYDGIHIAGANMGIVQQFLSPFYNARDDEFGGSLRERTRFLELVYEEIRTRVGEDVPVVTKVPAETASPPFVRSSLSVEDGVRIARRLEAVGFDALVPVEGSVFWDMSLIRGEYPDRAWSDSQFRDGYREAFGGRLRPRLVALAHRVHARSQSFDPAWNKPFCTRVREAVSVPVLAEGGIRRRAQMDRLLAEGRCDMVGMGRPFYAEPRIAARFLEDGATDGVPGDVEATCENCNNCTVPQVTGAPGVCRTPSVLRETGRLRKEGAYESVETDDRRT